MQEERDVCMESFTWARTVSSVPFKQVQRAVRGFVVWGYRDAGTFCDLLFC